MENKIVQNYGNKTNVNEEEKSQNNYSQYGNAYYYRTNQNNKNVVENPKVIQNKIITQNNEVNSSYQQNKKMLRINNQNNNSFQAQNEELLINKQIPIKNLQINSNYQTDKKQLNQDLSISNQKISAQRFQINSNNQINCLQQSFEDVPFPSRKPSQSFELNVNDINKYNNSNKKLSNIVNIDNQSSAIELCFIAKKPKKKYKISSICQVGVNQTPIVLSFLAQKPKQNINISTTNESSVQNLSFISSRQIDPNDISSFSKNDTFLSVPKPKNNLKIMTHDQIKNDNEKSNIKSKPKPVLQIVSKDKNKYNKILKQDLLSQSQISEFYIENNNKNKDSNNEIIKNNYLFISKGINEIPNNNNNQDLSFISNIKETENLFEINGININDYKININNSGNVSPPKDKNTFSGNVLSSSQQSANNNRSNIYSNYIMINYQFYYLSSIQRVDEDKDKNYQKSGLNKYNCSFPKKKIKTEYYDIQPVSFQCISSNYLEEEINIVKRSEYKNCEIEHVNKIHFYPFKIYRIVEIEYIVDKNEKKEEEKEEEKEEDKEEQETKDDKDVEEEEIIEVKQEEKQEEKKEEEKDEKKDEKAKEKQQNEDKFEIVNNNDNGKKRRKKRRKK